MVNESNTDYQYDKCSSRGICSINPTTASLQEIILIYLKIAAFYGLKTKECEEKNKIINLVLNTLSILSSNNEICETNFKIINSAFKTELPKIINELENKETDNLDILLKENTKLNDYIRYGEKEFNKRLKNISTETRNLYEILLILIKSLSINVLTYESYEKNAEDEILLIFKALNIINSFESKKEEIKNMISEISKKDCSLMIKIREAQEKLYGKQEESELSYSTTKGKAVLVVGSNLRELEQIADVFKDKNIDVYTHDNMVLAHTFPKFKEYKNLKGQFGQGMENCLLDFSTFPGPIILTRHSLFNIESLYRGLLFTTDFSYSKGVIRIKNDDFSDVIKSAEESKGFKTGKICNSAKVGFSQEKFINIIKEKLSKKNYKQIILAGIGGYSAEEKIYFKTFFKHTPLDILIVSLFCCEQRDNAICVNAMNDIYGMIRLIDEMSKDISQKITIMFPYADRHTLSLIINCAEEKNTKIYIGMWNQTIIKPAITKGLESEFEVLQITTPKNDLNNITDVK